MGNRIEQFLAVAKHQKLKLGLKKEILYDGVYYDVSNFIDRHPGGDVIEVFAHSRADATLPVQQFHHRSIKKVLAVMKSLPQRKATEEDMKTLGMDLKTQERHKTLTKDFNDLFETLKREGMFDSNPWHVFWRSIEVVFLCGLGLYLLRTKPLFLLTRIFGILSIGLGIGRAGWVTHEGAHHSLLGVPKWDRFISQFFIGFVMGLSKSYWNFEHNHHHSAPQHVKYDLDLDTLPLVVVSKKLITKQGSDIFGLMRYQKFLFLPFITIAAISVWKLMRHPYHCYIRGIYLDIVLMALHYIVFIGSAGFLNYFMALYVYSVYFFVSSQLSHAHLPVTEEPKHWVEYAFTHTANIRSSWWVDYYMGYLNYQIEHHLFPTMPQYKNKLCRDRVKDLAKKHNLPYHLFSYKEALIQLLDHLGVVAKEL